MTVETVLLFFFISEDFIKTKRKQLKNKHVSHIKKLNE